MYSFIRKTTLAALILGFSLTGLPAAVFAQVYVPPDRGLPGRREGGGTRGDCIASQPALTALMPETNYGTTTKAYPSFFWYVSQTQTQFAEFELWDSNDNKLYSATFQITGEPGIISLSLPDNASLPPLEVGQTYHWYFSLVCDADDRSGDIITEGWIERSQPDAALEDRLSRAAEVDRPAIYAESGIWYDALDSLMALRQAQPDNPIVLRSWRTLLESVDLTDFSDAPLVSCCDSNQTP